MKKPLTFKEFLYASHYIDEETYKTVILLAESHPSIQNDPTIQRLLNDKSARVSVSELSSVIRRIHQRSVYLARAAATVSDSQKLLILAEQNVMNTSAAALSVAVSARLQNSLDRISRINQATSQIRR